MRVPLIGRDRELTALVAELAGEQRLVTITGLPGIGKSRLAREVARRLGAETPSDELAGVFSCELGEAGSPEALADRVAETLQLSAEPSGAGDRVAALGSALRAAGPVLLLLDPFDRLVSFGAPMIGRWLSDAPESRFLICSRQRLALSEERVHELGPLGLPNADAAGAALELLLAAVRALRPDYAPGPNELGYLAELAKALEGNPLAIELAAPRLLVMSPRALLHRLESRFDVLRRSDGRHGSLSAAIDASLLALDEAELAALLQASIFAGPFSLEAAEAVLELGAHASSVLDVIQALREKSLLVPHTYGDELRLFMPVSIRELARQRIDPDALGKTRARHADYFAALAEACTAAGDRTRLLADRDDVLAVAARVLGARPVTARAATPALRALLALEPMLASGAPIDAYVALVDPVVEATAGSGADPRLIARALVLRGALALRAGRARSGSEDLVRALGLAESLADESITARALLELGRALAARGSSHAASEHFERALAIHRRRGERGDEATVLGSLALLSADAGDLGAAAAQLERARAAHEHLGDRLGQAEDRRALAAIRLDLGELSAAEGELERALEIARSLGDEVGLAQTGLLLGQLAQLRGELESARDRYRSSALVLGRQGLAGAAVATGWLGVLCRLEGKAAQAHALLTDASDALAAGGTDGGLAALFRAQRAALDVDVGALDDARAALDELAPACESDRPLAAFVALERARTVGDCRAELDAARALARSSARLRLSVACTERALARRTLAPRPPDAALVVGRQGLWFRPPHGERVALDRRRPLALVLERLASERLEHPGHALGWDVLLEAGWPGERVQAEAGAHRVRVALSTLRKLGLRELLVTTPEGYRLDPEVELSPAD